MAETISVTKTKTSKPAPSSFDFPSFEMPKFGLPNFDLPKMEVPVAFRDMAEKSLSQMKANYEKMKAMADETNDVLEDVYGTTAQGVSEYGLKVIEVSRTNTNAAFDFANGLFAVKSFADLIQLSTEHVHKQVETLTTQMKALTALSQKVATESVEPVKEGIAKAFNKIS